MTREEAIDILQNTSFFGRTIDDIDTAIDMAVKALEQQPCEDAISKASVFEILGNLMSIPYDFDRQITEKDVSESMDGIRALPSVTPQPKIGRWKRISMDKYVQHAMAYYKCSECGGDIIGEHNYCPSCGIKMEVEENG